MKEVTSRGRYHMKVLFSFSESADFFCSFAKRNMVGNSYRATFSSNNQSKSPSSEELQTRIAQCILHVRMSTSLVVGIVYFSVNSGHGACVHGRDSNPVPLILCARCTILCTRRRCSSRTADRDCRYMNY